MAKYSTGGGAGTGGGQSCELCGKETADLRTATVAGAELDVCGECAPHDDAADENRETPQPERERTQRAVKNVARSQDAGGDSRHWEEEGTNYDRDQLPYLVSDYGERAEQARQEAGLQRGELAAELDIDENDLLAVEQGRAARADVGGSVIEAIEDYLDVRLAEE